ncbi:MAG TPA: DUF378 domain-containing protein [Candidatus Paceibacterota bacterium]|nr:DUF378 domain-containing protein [Candidatus Paceibacterota bacterium]
MKNLHSIAFILVVVGAINWGLVGLGWLMGGSDWNLVNLVLGSWMQLEAIVYVLVGASGVYLVATHKQTCRDCN